jgi:hypothetical protein
VDLTVLCAMECALLRPMVNDIQRTKD